jgi:hypothetical protein
MNPKAKMMLENLPANGFSELAACAALWTFTMWWTCSVSAAGDDRKHHNVGEGHAGEHVETTGAFLERRSRLASVPQGSGLVTAFWVVAHLLEAVGALPEEQVRRDCGAEHGHQECNVVLVEFNLRYDGVEEDATPVVGHHDDDER